MPEFTAMTWNLHGKSLQALQNLVDRTEDPWDFLFLQELGGFSRVPEGEFHTDHLYLAGQPCTVVVHQAPLSHHAVAIVFRDQLDLLPKTKTSFGVGFILECSALGRKLFLGTGHFPHQQRRDSLDAWLTSLSNLDELLSLARYCDCILLGLDCNQNLLFPNSTFAGLSRLLFLCGHRGLEFNPQLGNTWEARNESSSIDWILFRWPGVEMTFHLRPDLKIALPSDHIPIVGTFWGRTSLGERPPRPKHGCGRWITSLNALTTAARDPDFAFTQQSFQDLCKNNSSRHPSRKYHDPPEIQELIRLRKIQSNPAERLALMNQIHDARTEAQRIHRVQLLKDARDGDRAAISHLRRSASQTFSEGSFIERLGGQEKAADCMMGFYSRKYSLPSDELPVLQEQVDKLRVKHSVIAKRVRREEVQQALDHTKPNTASGHDSVCYSAIKAFFAEDSADKLVVYFDDIIQGRLPIPEAWKKGKLCFIPKCPRPSRPQDLRPISLTPCLGKIFTRLLISRLDAFLPEYKAGQHACRKGAQSLQAVTCAQACMKIFRGDTGKGLHLMKLDISQAFDTLSHHAVLRFLLETKPCAEASLLWEFCNNTSVDLQLGTHAWSQKLGRGLLQGTSFSADVFSRVLDFFLSPLLNTWKQTAHKTFSRFDLPHLLLFADDILVLGSSAAELQAKLHDLQHCLSVIGLHINFAKCSVLHNEDGGCPGVWPYKWSSPLQGCNDLVYLGVPLSHKQTPLGQLGVSLARVSSSFFALRKLFDHPSTPVVTKTFSQLRDFQVVLVCTGCLADTPIPPIHRCF